MARPPSSSSARRFALAACLVLLWILEGTGQARTVRLVKEGIKLLNRAQYVLAIGKFHEAYQDDKTLTRTLLLTGVCHLNLDQIADALSFYERFEDEEREMDAEDHEHLVTYYEEAERRLQRLPTEGPERTLLAARIAVGRGRLIEAAGRFDEYEREKGALSEPEAAALKAQRRRLSGILRGRLATAKDEGEALLLVRLLTGLGEWKEALERLAAARAGGDAGGPELDALRGVLVAAQRQDAKRRELLLFVGYAELLRGDQAAALDRYEAYRKERPKAAPDGPFEPQLRQLAERTLADAEARKKAEAEAKKRAAAEAEAARRAAAARAAAEALRPRPAPVPPKQPIYKKWWLWTAIGGGVALGVGAAVLGTQLGRTQAATPQTNNVYTPTF